VQGYRNDEPGVFGKRSKVTKANDGFDKLSDHVGDEFIFDFANHNLDDTTVFEDADKAVYTVRSAAADVSEAIDTAFATHGACLLSSANAIDTVGAEILPYPTTTDTTLGKEPVD